MARLFLGNPSRSQQSISLVDSASQRRSLCQQTHCGADPRFLNHLCPRPTSSSGAWCTRSLRTGNNKAISYGSCSHSQRICPQRIQATVVLASHHELRSGHCPLVPLLSCLLYALDYRRESLKRGSRSCFPQFFLGGCTVMVRDLTETSERWNGHIADFDNLRHVEELVNQRVAGFRINQDQMSRENSFHLILLD